MPQICPADTIKNGDSFLDEAIGIQLFLFLQFVLFGHSLYHEYINRNEQKFLKQRRLRFWFFLLQIVAICLLLNEFIKLLDSWTFIVRGNMLCSLIPYVTKTISAVFYAVYLHQISLRLRLSFAGSHLALSKWTIAITQIIIVSIPSIVCVLVLIDSAGSSLHCLRTWHPGDVAVTITYCTIPWDSLSLLKEYGLYALLTVANLLNISFGVIFVVKLRKITAHNTNERIDRQFRELIVKNTILTLVGCCSSFLGYLLYAATDLASWVYLDSFINCGVIALMFSVNEVHYNRLCGQCTRCYFKKFGDGKERVTDLSQFDSASRESPLSTSPSARRLKTLSPSTGVLMPQSTMRSVTVAAPITPLPDPDVDQSNR